MNFGCLYPATLTVNNNSLDNFFKSQKGLGKNHSARATFHASEGLTRHKISDGGRERAWQQVECGSHRTLERGAARRSLHRLVRWWRGSPERRGAKVWKDGRRRTHQRHGNRTLEKDEAKQPTRGGRRHGTGSPYPSRASADKTCNSRSRPEPKSVRTTESDSKPTDE